MMVFGRLEGEITDTAVTALAVLAYNLSLNTNPVIESGAAVDIHDTGGTSRDRIQTHATQQRRVVCVRVADLLSPAQDPITGQRVYPAAHLHGEDLQVVAT